MAKPSAVKPAAQKVLQTNVSRPGPGGTTQTGRIVERPGGQKVFLVGKTTGGSAPRAAPGGVSLPAGYTPYGPSAEESAIEGRIRGITEGPGALEFARELGGREDEALASFATAQRAQPSLESLYGQYTTEAGVPGMQTTIGGLRGQIARTEELLERLRPGIEERTAPHLVTEAQRERMEVAERRPLAQQLGQFGRTLGVSSQNLQDVQETVRQRLGFAATQQERELEPLRMNISMISDRAARLMTGFTADRETKLNALLDQLTSRRGYTQANIQLANQLAQQSEEYERSRKDFEQNLSLNAGLTPGTQRRSPLGEYLESQRQLQRQEELTDYERKQQIEKKYRKGTGDGTGTDILGTLGLLKSLGGGLGSDWEIPTSGQTMQPSPMSGRPGARIEYPPGSGVIWTADERGNWR